EVVFDRKQIEKSRCLGNETDLSDESPSVFETDPVEPVRAAGRNQPAREQFEKSRFPCAVVSYQRDQLSFFDVETARLEPSLLFIGFGKSIDFELERHAPRARS